VPADGAHQYFAPMVSVLSSLTKELQNIGAGLASSQRHIQQPLDGHRTFLKKRRVEDNTSDAAESVATTTPTSNLLDLGYSQHDQILHLWDDIVDCYFRFINPWLSILHEPSVRKGLQTTPKQQPYPQIFQAMISGALRFVKSNGSNLPNHFLVEQASRAKREIMVSVMDEVSIEHVQTLLILAYAEICDDNPRTASALLGIVAREIDDLQLSMEKSSVRCAGVFGSSHTPREAVDWIEEEERRRVYWGTIILDRLCATLLGCSTSLSSAPIRRRLPVCASFWGTNQPRPTPHLRSFTKPSTSADGSASTSSASGETSPDRTQNPNNNEESQSSGIGALAFYIETVESMWTIESEFLRKPVNCSNSHDVARWLTRFKDLDAYLMR
jgi:hypothetical protein